MYSKDELSVKSREELADIAKTLELNPDEYDKQEDLVYAILDRQAEVEGSKNPINDNRRKRNRDTKAKDRNETLFPEITDPVKRLLNWKPRSTVSRSTEDLRLRKSAISCGKLLH